MRRSDLWVVGLSLLALSLSARPALAGGIPTNGPPTPAFAEEAVVCRLLAPDQRSAVLRRSGGVPVLVSSTVIGPYEEVEARRSIFAATYLEDCGDCTQTTPCDTECGWDPGKGGPVTCGEYGVCQPDPCYWELVQTLGWCDTDFDTHFGYFSVEIFGERRYQHTCTGATCYDKYQIDETHCPFGPLSCNSSASGCCQCAYPSSFCGASPGCRNDCPF